MTTKKITFSTKILTLVKDGEVNADQANRTKKGRVIIRAGYFYSHGCTSELFSNRISNQLTAMGIAHKVTASGNHWEPFNGGAPIQKQSHWWVEIEEVTVLSEAAVA